MSGFEDVLPARPGVLIATADRPVHAELATRLERAGYSVRVCESGAECLALLDGGGFGVLLVAATLPGIPGLDLIRALRARRNTRECVLMVEEATEELLARAALLNPVQVQTVPYLIAHARFIVNDIVERMEDLPKATAATRPVAGSAATRERRRQPRFEVDEAPGSLRPSSPLSLLGLGGASADCVVADLSEGGASLYSGKPLAPGRRVHLEIRFERFQSTLQATAEVRWCRQRPREGDGFHAGLSFTNLPSATAKTISMLKGLFEGPEIRAQREIRKETRRRLRSGGAPPPAAE